MSRTLLELNVIEKNAGNWKKSKVSEIGKRNLEKRFAKRMGYFLPWDKMRNRLDHLKKLYDIFRKITYEEIDLRYEFDSGALDMPDDWWQKKLEMFPEATKIRSTPLRDIELLDKIYGDATVVVLQSWQPRDGPKKRHLKDVADDSDVMQPPQEKPLHTELPNMMSQDPTPSEVPETTQDPDHSPLPRPSRVNGPKSKKRDRSQQRASMEMSYDRLATSYEERTRAFISDLNSTRAPDPYSLPLVVEALRRVPGLVYKSRLYWMSLRLLESRESIRQIFMAHPEEDRMDFLFEWLKEYDAKLRKE